jgi:hypothetical protein
LPADEGMCARQGREREKGDNSGGRRRLEAGDVSCRRRVEAAAPIWQQQISTHHKHQGCHDQAMVWWHAFHSNTQRYAQARKHCQPTSNLTCKDSTHCRTRVSHNTPTPPCSSGPHPTHLPPGHAATRGYSTGLETPTSSAVKQLHSLCTAARHSYAPGNAVSTEERITPRSTLTSTPPCRRAAAADANHAACRRQLHTPVQANACMQPRVCACPIWGMKVALPPRSLSLLLRSSTAADTVVLLQHEHRREGQHGLLHGGDGVSQDAAPISAAPYP